MVTACCARSNQPTNSCRAQWDVNGGKEGILLLNLPNNVWYATGLRTEAFPMWTMWAGNSKSYFSHPQPTRAMAKLYERADEVVEVEVREDAEGTYFGWIDAPYDSEFPSMVWPSRVQLEMCFAGGTQVEVDRGKGRVVQLSIVLKQPERV